MLIKFDASKQVQVDYSGIPVVQRYKQNQQPDYHPDISPLRRIVHKIKQHAGHNNACYGERVTHIHSPLVEARLRFQANPTVGTGGIHLIELPDMADNRILKNITGMTPRAFTQQ